MEKTVGSRIQLVILDSKIESVLVPTTFGVSTTTCVNSFRTLKPFDRKSDNMNVEVFEWGVAKVSIKTVSPNQEID